jgi:hypothetical protein
MFPGGGVGVGVGADKSSRYITQEPGLEALDGSSHVILPSVPTWIAPDRCPHGGRPDAARNTSRRGEEGRHSKGKFAKRVLVPDQHVLMFAQHCTVPLREIVPFLSFLHVAQTQSSFDLSWQSNPPALADCVYWIGTGVAYAATHRKRTNPVHTVGERRWVRLSKSTLFRTGLFRCPIVGACVLDSTHTSFLYIGYIAIYRWDI